MEKELRTVNGIVYEVSKTPCPCSCHSNPHITHFAPCCNNGYVEVLRKFEKELLLIDMDDTMCNFEAAFMLALQKNPSIMFPQSQLKFFENLEPIKGAVESYNALKSRYEVKILTKPSVYNPLSYMEKRLWVEKHLGFKECENLILCCDKTLVRGKYLVDDWPQSGLFKPEWEHIHFRTEKYPSWEKVCEYLL